MAEGKRREPGAQLEELNDQLARFLQHADQLLEDWARFGAQVRSTVDQEVARIEAGAAEAGERATRQLAAQVDKIAHERVDRAVGEGLTRVKAELARAGHGTAVAAPSSSAPPNRALVGAIVLANVLLVVLLAVTLMRGGAKAPAGGGAIGPDAGEAAATDDIIEACAGLIEAWSDDDAAIVLRSGVEACGPYAPDVEKLIRARLFPAPIDAGVVDAAPPIDAKRKTH